MRIDRFLFFIRLVKSRTLAQGIVETGHVRIEHVVGKDAIGHRVGVVRCA